jgi:hypothetical protein
MRETRNKKERVGLRTAGLWPAFLNLRFEADGKTESQPDDNNKPGLVFPTKYSTEHRRPYRL